MPDAKILRERAARARKVAEAGRRPNLYLRELADRYDKAADALEPGPAGERDRD